MSEDKKFKLSGVQRTVYENVILEKHSDAEPSDFFDWLEEIFSIETAEPMRASDSPLLAEILTAQGKDPTQYVAIGSRIDDTNTVIEYDSEPTSDDTNTAQECEHGPTSDENTPA